MVERPDALSIVSTPVSVPTPAGPLHILIACHLNPGRVFLTTLPPQPRGFLEVLKRLALAAQGAQHLTEIIVHLGG